MKYMSVDQPCLSEWGYGSIRPKKVKKTYSGKIIEWVKKYFLKIKHEQLNGKFNSN